VWNLLLKRTTPLDILRGGLSPYLDDADWERRLEEIDNYRDSESRSQKKRDFNKLIEELGKYSKNKDGFIREFKENFREGMDISIFRAKMDLALQRYGTKKRQTSVSPRAKLLSLAREIEESMDSSKMNEFMSLAEKHPKIIIESENLRQLKKQLEKLSKGSMLYFKTETPPAEVLDAFLKLMGGEVINYGKTDSGETIQTILYPNLSVGEWMKKWNASFEELKQNISRNPERVKTLKPLLEEIKDSRPIILQAGIKEDVPLDSVKFYSVEGFTDQSMREFLEIINKTGGNVDKFIPSGVSLELEGINVKGSSIKELVFSTKQGGTIRTNPYLSLLLEAIGESDWFSTLLSRTKQSKIIDKGRLIALINMDAERTFNESLSTSPIFGLEVNEDEAPEELDKYKRWFRSQIDIASTSNLLQEEITPTISPKVKNILDDAIEKFGLERFLVRPNLHKVSSIDFEPVTIKGISRFKLVDGEKELTPKQIEALSNKITQKLQKEVSSAQRDTSEELPTGFIASLASDSALLQSIKSETAVNRLLAAGSFQQLMSSYPLIETSKKSAKITTFSALSPENLIIFFVKLDDLTGFSTQSNSVLEYYERIDASKDFKERKRIISQLEKSIEEKIISFRNALQVFFEENLRKLISQRRLPKKLLDKLIDKGIVTEVSV
tara:strand:- start:322 stop:2328 length:2007 start_codon:yes stop_codon:yes gene_type:complete